MGLTRTQLGRLISISQGKTSKIEKNRQDSGLGLAERLCWALRRPNLLDLLGEAPSDPPTDKPADEPPADAPDTEPGPDAPADIAG